MFLQMVGVKIHFKKDEGKGGTWSGATQTLKHNWSVVYVRNNKAYSGN